MAQLPGLSPFTEDRPDAGGRVGARVQVNTPQFQRRARPTSTGVDTYSRPGAPQIDTGTDLAQLAQSLSALNPALARFAEVEQQSRQEDAQAAVEAKIGGMTFDERQKAVKEGLPEFADPWFKAAFVKSYGQSKAAWRRDQMAADWENFDRVGGDISQFFASHMKDDLEELKGYGKHAISGYSAAMRNYTQGFQQQHAAEIAKDAEEKKQATVFEGFRGTYLEGKSAGASPETIAKTLWDRTRSNKELLRMPFAEQNKLVMGMLQQVANEGDEATLNSILNFDRGGGVGKLADVPAFQANVLQLQNLAKAKAAERVHQASIPTLDQFRVWADNGELEQHKDEVEAFQQQNPKVLTPEHLLSLYSHDRSKREALVNQQIAAGVKLRLEQGYKGQIEAVTEQLLALSNGSGLQFTPMNIKVLNKEGNEETISQDKAIEMATEAYIKRQSPLIAKQNKESPEQQFNREAEWFTRNGVPHPEWRNLLERGYIAASPSTVTSINNVPEGLVKGAQLYMDLKAKAPNLVRTMLKDKAALDFYDAFAVSKEFAGLDDKEAYANAVRATRELSTEHQQSMRLRYDDIKNQVNSMTGFFTGLSDFSNKAEVMSQVERVAQLYVRTGLSTDLALKEAQKRVKAQYTVIGGKAVNVGDRGVGDPAEFSRLVGKKLDDWHTTNGAVYGVDRSELSIAPLSDGSGGWMIVRADGVPAGLNNAFSTRDLGSIREKEDADKRAELAKQAEANKPVLAKKAQQRQEASDLQQSRLDQARNEMEQLLADKRAYDEAERNGTLPPRHGLIGGLDSNALVKVGKFKPSNVINTD